MPTPRRPIPRAAVAAIRGARDSAESALSMVHAIREGSSRDIVATAAEIARLLLAVVSDLNEAEKSTMPLRPRRPQVSQPVQYRDANGTLHAATIVAVMSNGRVQLLVTIITDNHVNQEVRDAGPDESSRDRHLERTARELAALLALARWQWRHFPAVCRPGVRRG